MLLYDEKNKKSFRNAYDSLNKMSNKKTKLYFNILRA